MQKKLFQTLVIMASILLPGINLAANSSSTATVTNLDTGVAAKIYPGTDGNSRNWSFSCTNTNGCSFKISGDWIDPNPTICKHVDYNNYLSINYYSNIDAVIECNYSPSLNGQKQTLQP